MLVRMKICERAFARVQYSNAFVPGWLSVRISNVPFSNSKYFLSNSFVLRRIIHKMKTPEKTVNVTPKCILFVFYLLLLFDLISQKKKILKLFYLIFQTSNKSG